MGYKHLCLIFGCTPTVCSRVITSMLKLVVKKLKRHPLARVQWPDEEKMAEYAQLIHQREPAVDDVIGFMDGVSLTSECTSKPLVQNSMYSLVRRLVPTKCVSTKASQELGMQLVACWTH